jgi:hypothetical protein
VIRRNLVLFAAAAIVLITALPASAMCIPGRVGVDPKTGKVTIELPRCDPPPR